MSMDLMVLAMSLLLAVAVFVVFEPASTSTGSLGTVI